MAEKKKSNVNSQEEGEKQQGEEQENTELVRPDDLTLGKRAWDNFLIGPWVNQRYQLLQHTVTGLVDAETEFVDALTKLAQTKQRFRVDLPHELAEQTAIAQAREHEAQQRLAQAKLANDPDVIRLEKEARIAALEAEKKQQELEKFLAEQRLEQAKAPSTAGRGGKGQDGDSEVENKMKMWKQMEAELEKLKKDGKDENHPLYKMVERDWLRRIEEAD